MTISLTIVLYIVAAVALFSGVLGFLLGVTWTRDRIKKNPEQLAKLVVEAKAARDKMRETLTELGWIDPK